MSSFPFSEDIPPYLSIISGVSKIIDLLGGTSKVHKVCAKIEKAEVVLHPPELLSDCVRLFRGHQLHHQGERISTNGFYLRL